MSVNSFSFREASLFVCMALCALFNGCAVPATEKIIRAAVYEEMNGLRLDVTAEIEIHRGIVPETKKWGIKERILIIRSVITNVGKRPITVPSNSYDGGPSCWATGGDSYGICFTVGPRRMEGKKLIASPWRYFPVILQPGESTELPEYHAENFEYLHPKKVDVGFIVDEAYAKKQGWWFGELRRQVDITSDDSSK